MQLMTEAQVDAFVFFDLPNIRYLCGFTGSDGVLLVAPENSCFLSDSRYQTQARDEVTADDVVCYQKQVPAVAAELQRLDVRRVGFSSETLSVSKWRELSERTNGEIEFVAIDKALRSLRAVKDAEEIAALEQAAELNQQAFDEIRPLLVPGTKEQEIALALEIELKRRGGEVNAFDFIVASGERGAFPHGLASSKVLRQGELVTIDFGTRINGYYSDETVTVSIGETDEKMRDIYAIVLTAHDRAVAAVRPGLAMVDLDAVARSYIAEQGYSDYFGHGLGHGLGLEVHEYPALSPRAEGDLEVGMVITIEPGIYLPDVGGVRIEDTVLVTADGCRCLTRIPKRFQQFPA